MEKFKVNIETGLTNEEVQKRINDGLVNKTNANKTKSYKRIFMDNIFTLFNFVNFVLALIIIPTGSYKNLLFLGVVLSNFVIGSFQEIRAKRTLDKISLIVTLKAMVLRDGKKQEISIDEVVLDDLLISETGNQIISDSIVLNGMVEVDESLLTGESDVVKKEAGDFLYSGSFVVSGTCMAQVERVGDENYAAKITRDAKKFKRYPSQLRDSLNSIIKIIGIIIIPLGIGMFLQSYFVLGETYHDSVLKISAALIGMIPEGLVILTSIALTVGTINLAKKKTLVQELYCLETLARVDTLCLDKTGTLTEGTLEIEQIHMIKEVNIEEIIGNFLHCVQDNNATYLAMWDKYEKQEMFTCLHSIPFSSKRKFSAASFKERTYVVGAYEYICKVEEDKREIIESYAKQGYRVISLCYSKQEMIDDSLPCDLEVVAFLIMADKIRPDAAETLAYFYEQGVDVKIISGDHALTVSEVSRRAGVHDADLFIDATTLSSEDIPEAVKKYNVFGRVTPQQKKEMIVALRRQNHIVGMTGDGVNDVLAFKKADISIAMASGSDAAKASANLVLLDNNFDALPHVLYEGRRVINNIEKVATLFLTKTILSLLVSCLVVAVGMTYPFVPIQLTFISTTTIGIPAFILALEANHERVKGKFVENVLRISLPSAISIVVVLAYIIIMSRTNAITKIESTQLAFLTLAINGLIVLIKVAQPLSKLRIVLLIGVVVSLVVGFLCFPSFFEIKTIIWSNLFIPIAVIIAVLLGVSHLGTNIVSRIYQKRRR